MNKILMIFAALLAGAWAYNRYEPSYVRFESDESDDADDYSEPMPYGFEYDVNDGQNNFGHRQQSDGKVTTGSYRVALPDGRTQIVTYRADHNGYNAKVTYEPTFSHHHYTPAYHHHHHHQHQQHQYSSNPSDYAAAAVPEPLFYRTRPSSTTTTTTTTPATPVKPLPYRHFPLYEFPGIAPYHGPSNAYGAYDPFTNDRHYPVSAAAAVISSSSSSATIENNKEDDSSDEELPLVPLIFRTSHVESDAVRGQQQDQQLRSGYGKRSPIDIWSETDITAALDAPLPAPVAAVEDVSTPASTTTTDAEIPVDEVPSATEVVVAAVDQVESQTDHPAASVTAGTSADEEEFDFDLLPFPLPLPLAFRPDAAAFE